MDLKKKLQSLVKTKTSNTQNIDHQDINHSSFTEGGAISKFKEHIAESHYDPRIDQENIDSIEENYFTSDSQFDPREYELKALSDSHASVEDINSQKKKLERQLQSVSKRVSELILENHPAYAAELKRVMELQQSLQMALLICSQSRQSLQSSQQQFTITSMLMLANHRKRQQLQSLMRSLRTIKTLQRTDVRLREMLEKEDYAGAIELCLECQKAASIFRHYTCISELSSKLQDTLDMIEEQLDVALSRTCDNFDVNHYSKVQLAYQLLGKTQTSMDQLLMHFASTIHNIAFTVVLGYVELCSGTGDNSFQKKQYPELCKYITYESFIPCLKDLCKALWGVLVNYHKTYQWHQSHDQQTDLRVDQTTDSDSQETDFSKKYVEQKLEHGRGRLWQEIQLKVRSILLAVNLSSFKFNEFTHVLNLVNRLVAVGEEFAGVKSDLLQEAMHKQTHQYFLSYHSSRLEEVKMFVENEAWELVPVRPSFTILQLQEFSFMRPAVSNNTAFLHKLATQSHTTNDHPASEEPFSFFSQESSPFDEQQEEEFREDFLANGDNISSESDDDIAEELKADSIDEDTGRIHIHRKHSLHKKYSRQKSTDRATSGPIITNTSLTVLRQFGKYMRMVSLLEPIAFEVISSMSKLLDFYLYSVYKRFAINKVVDDPVDKKLCISSKLQTTLHRVTRELQQAEPNGSELSSHQQQGSIENLYNLSEKLVAVESLVYLAKQFEFLHPNLEKMIPVNKKAFLQQFYSQTVSTIPELRYPVYLDVTDRLLNTDHIVSLISSVKWDIKDIMSQHNSYVDVILRELQTFSMRVSDMANYFPIPPDVQAILWQQCGKSAALIFVEGYSCVKKCTPEGRALMQLDFQQFLMKFEKISDMRPVPGREYVETYIKAYYLPEDKLEIWTKEHKEYTSKQLVTLINCVPQLNKKAKQRITSQIEDPDKLLKKDVISSPLVHIQNLGKKHLRDNSS